MRKFGWLSTLLMSAAIGCGSDPPVNTPTPDAMTPGDDVTMEAAVQEEVGTDARTDVRVDTRADADAAVVVDGPASNAGRPCTMPDPMGGMDPACGDTLVCIPTGTTPMCTTNCENDASQVTERSSCGGTGSTCLTQGDGDTASSICTASCRPGAMTVATGACRAGQVCTGWWYTHSGARPDATGCFPFCSTNADCGTGAAGMVCNARTGSCGMTAVDTTRLPDGSPCNPMMRVTVPGEMTARNIQCRGICFSTSSARPTQGICGSFINTRIATACPDDPDALEPRAPQGADNLAICIFRGCTTNSDCRSPHICRYPEDAMGMPATDNPPTCDYPSTAQPMGIPGDGGMTGDAAVDAAPGDAAPADAPRPDAAPADAAPADAAADRTDAATTG